MRNGILFNTFWECLSSFSISSRRFSEFDAGNTILLKVNIFGRKKKETMLAIYLIKITAHSIFTRLRMIRQIENLVTRRYGNHNFSLHFEVDIILFLSNSRSRLHSYLLILLVLANFVSDILCRQCYDNGSRFVVSFFT